VTRRMHGFSILELVVAMALMLALLSVVFASVGSSQDAMSAQIEAADMQQRIRVAADRLQADLAAAGSPGVESAPVFPYRALTASPDPAGTVRTDAITLASAAGSVTYWWRGDDGTGVPQLMIVGASGRDVPVADHIVSVSFRYFGDPRPPSLLKPLDEPDGPWTTYGPKPSLDAVAPYGPGENCVFVDDGSGAPLPRLPTLAAGDGGLAELSAGDLSDGPWCPDASAADRWDADLLRVRSIAVTLRAQAALASLRGPAGPLFAIGGTSTNAARWAPDLVVEFRVSPRNLNLRP
jgi:type II secretory pathway pseudopilin PulG